MEMPVGVKESLEALSNVHCVLKRCSTFTLVLGTLFGSVSSTASIVILTVYVYASYDSSPYAVSALFVIGFLPNLLIAPLASALTERRNPRITLGLLGIIRSIVMLLPAVGVDGHWYFAIAFSITATNSVSKPCRYALAPLLASGRHLVALNSLFMMMTTVAGVASGSVVRLADILGGSLLFVILTLVSAMGAGFDAAYVHNSFVHRASTSNLSTEKIALSTDIGKDVSEVYDSTIKSDEYGLLKRLRAGRYLIFNTPPLFALTISTFLLWVCLGVQEPLLIVFVDKALHASHATYGYMISIGSLGGVFGALFSVMVGKSVSRAIHSFSCGMLLAGASFLVFAVSGDNRMFAFVSFFIFSVSYGVSNVFDEYLEQELSPAGLRATVISIIGAIGTLGYLLGTLSSGYGSNGLGPRNIFIGIGILLISTGMYSTFKMPIREARV